MEYDLGVLTGAWQITGLDNYMINLLLVSVVSAMLILLFKALRPIFKEHYTVRLKQFLWILLAVRLIVPFSSGDTVFHVQSVQYDTGAKVYISENITDEADKNPEAVYMTLPQGLSKEESIESDTSINLVSKNAEAFSNEVVAVSRGDINSAPTTVKEKNWKEKLRYYVIQGISLITSHMNTIFLVYIIGVVLFLVYHFGVLIHFNQKRKKMRLRVENPEYLNLLQEAAKRIGVKKLPVLYQIDNLASPMATGFLRFAVYIPAEEYSEKEFRAIITHELTHIYHQDLRIKMLYLLANAFHWFNPAVYLMLREAGRDMELYCDKSVVKMFQWEERQEYNEILLNILRNHTSHFRQEYLTTCFNGGIKEMKERFLNNLDMAKKKEGILPIVLTGGVIAVSAVLFSVDVQAVENAGFDDFWAVWIGESDKTEESDEAEQSDLAEKNDDTVISDTIAYEWSTEEIQNLLQNKRPFVYDETVVDNQFTYTMGDESCEQVPIRKNGKNYIVPIHLNDFDGNAYVENTVIEADGKQWKEAPKVRIFCGTTPIESYAVEVNDWQDGDVPKLPDDVKFFEEQCARGEENPVFDVLSWTESHVEGIRLFFPEGQMPDALDVTDVVLNEDGTPRYEGKSAEIIYRCGSVDSAYSVASFSLAEHYSIAAYEDLYDKEAMAQPFYRGYKIRCYWGGKEKLQSATYYIVLRTRSTVY